MGILERTGENQQSEFWMCCSPQNPNSVSDANNELQ